MKESQFKDPLTSTCQVSYSKRKDDEDVEATTDDGDTGVTADDGDMGGNNL